HRADNATPIAVDQQDSARTFIDLCASAGRISQGRQIWSNGLGFGFEKDLRVTISLEQLKIDIDWNRASNISRCILYDDGQRNTVGQFAIVIDMSGNREPGRQRWSSHHCSASSLFRMRRIGKRLLAALGSDSSEHGASTCV